MRILEKFLFILICKCVGKLGGKKLQFLRFPHMTVLLLNYTAHTTAHSSPRLPSSLGLLLPPSIYTEINWRRKRHPRARLTGSDIQSRAPPGDKIGFMEKRRSVKFKFNKKLAVKATAIISHQEKKKQINPFC